MFDFTDVEFQVTEDNNLEVVINSPFYDPKDHEKIVKFFSLEENKTEKMLHNCGSSYGCDCPQFPHTREWASRKFKQTSVDAEAGFNFIYIGEKDLLERDLEGDEKKLKIYKFTSASGLGVCFTTSGERLSYAPAIMLY